MIAEFKRKRRYAKTRTPKQLIKAGLIGTAVGGLGGLAASQLLGGNDPDAQYVNSRLLGALGGAPGVGLIGAGLLTAGVNRLRRRKRRRRF